MCSPTGGHDIASFLLPKNEGLTGKVLHFIFLYSVYLDKHFEMSSSEAIDKHNKMEAVQ